MLSERLGHASVAFTLQTYSMTLVSSFAHTDMDPSRGSNFGRAALTIPELNPFEISVRDALATAGIPLLPQHGASGYRIDFAARHPSKPGRMVLAIECDGASYHAAPTARDRLHRAVDETGSAIPDATVAESLPTRGPRPPVPAGLPIDQYSQRDLIAITHWVESDTLLRTEDQVLAEVMRTLGFQRRGSKIVATIQRVIRPARRSR